MTHRHASRMFVKLTTVIVLAVLAAGALAVGNNEIALVATGGLVGALGKMNGDAASGPSPERRVSKVAKTEESVGGD